MISKDLPEATMLAYDSASSGVKPWHGPHQPALIHRCRIKIKIHHLNIKHTHLKYRPTTDIEPRVVAGTSPDFEERDRLKRASRGAVDHPAPSRPPPGSPEPGLEPIATAVK